MPQLVPLERIFVINIKFTCKRINVRPSALHDHISINEHFRPRMSCSTEVNILKRAQKKGEGRGGR